MKKGYGANEGLGRDPPICRRPQCKTAAGCVGPRPRQVQTADLLPLRLSMSAGCVNSNLKWKALTDKIEAAKTSMCNGGDKKKQHH